MNTTKAEIKTEILTVCYAKMQVIAAMPDPPAWKWWDVDDLKEWREHGPAYSSADWFGCGTDAHRMRYARALKELEAEGLVEPWCRCGLKMTNLKLTAAGVAMVDGMNGVPNASPLPTSVADQPPSPSTFDQGAGI